MLNIKTSCKECDYEEDCDHKTSSGCDKGNKKLNKTEEMLMRKGNVLTPIGLYRAIAIHNYKITKKRFQFLVKKNYMFEEDLNDNFIKKIDDVWNYSIEMFKDWGVFVYGSDEEIKISDPMQGFFDDE